MLIKLVLTAKDGINSIKRGIIQLANFIFGRLLSKAISHLSKEKGPFSFVFAILGTLQDNAIEMILHVIVDSKAWHQ